MEAVTTDEKTAALKGRMVSITALEVFTADLEEINRQLQEKASKARAFFDGAPLLLDLSNLDEEVDFTWLGRVAAIISDSGFVSVGVAGAPESLEEIAKSAGIPVWPSSGITKNAPQPEYEEPEQESVEKEREPVEEIKDIQEPEVITEPDSELEEEEISVEVPPAEPEIPVAEEQPAPVTEPAEPVTEPEIQEEPKEIHAKTQIQKTPVRSGQRVYAKGGDLIVLSSVSTGAEVMADGHVHVYGTLRGRALAGVKGDENARIFCHNLQADLIAIAGYYLTNEDLPEEKRGSAVQISLTNEHLNIDAL